MEGVPRPRWSFRSCKKSELTTVHYAHEPAFQGNLREIPICIQTITPVPRTRSALSPNNSRYWTPQGVTMGRDTKPITFSRRVTNNSLIHSCKYLGSSPLSGSIFLESQFTSRTICGWLGNDVIHVDVEGARASRNGGRRGRGSRGGRVR